MVEVQRWTVFEVSPGGSIRQVEHPTPEELAAAKEALLHPFKKVSEGLHELGEYLEPLHTAHTALHAVNTLLGFTASH